MEQFDPPPANVTTIPIADVTAPSSGGNVEYEAYPVRKPEQDLNDFKVQVFASTLARCRTKLEGLAVSRFPWHEVFLGVSTLAAGAFLGALPVEMGGNGLLATLFRSAMPAIAAASFVAYFFLRKTAAADSTAVAAEVLAELPDPRNTR